MKHKNKNNKFPFMLNRNNRGNQMEMMKESIAKVHTTSVRMSKGGPIERGQLKLLNRRATTQIGRQKYSYWAKIKTLT